MAQDTRHKRFLRFVRKVMDVPLGYSKEDLTAFRNLTKDDYPSLVPLIDEYVRLAERSETDVDAGRPKGKGRPDRVDQMHLFDLLRQKQLFPSNADLANFASRILPGIKGRRFNKMSRGDIAARIIEYLETRQPRTREELEISMRGAMNSGSKTPEDQRSFFSRWERIIKGIKL